MPLVVNNHVVPTTIYHIPGPNRQAPIFYMIPGNPGLCEFYETFLEELKTLYPEFEYLCPSHIGFDTLTQPNYGLHPGDTNHTLDEQIQHKISLLREWVRGESNGNNKTGRPRDVVIMGHSVGAWMVQRIATAFRNDPVVHIKLVGLLTPTIMDIAQSDRGKKLMTIAKYVSPGTILPRASQLLTWAVPQSYVKSALQYIMGSPSEVAVNAASSLVTKPKIVKQALEMAAEEMHRIGSEIEPSDIKGFWDADNGYRIWLYFVKEDHWVANVTREYILKETDDAPHVSSVVEDEDSAIVHAFCVRDSNHVAELVCKQMKEIKFHLGDPNDVSASPGSETTASAVPGTTDKARGFTELRVVDVEADGTKPKLV